MKTMAQVKIRRFYPQQAHRSIHRAIACVEMPVDVLKKAVELATSQPDPFADAEGARVMGQVERHPAIGLLCDWWNSNAPVTTTRCAGYAMVWEREGDRYLCSYCETPKSPLQNFMRSSSSLARVGDDLLIEFWKGSADFSYDGRLGMQTWRVNGERGWTCSVAEVEVRSGKYDEAWYGLDGLRQLKKRTRASGDLAFPGAVLSGLTLIDE